MLSIYTCSMILFSLILIHSQELEQYTNKCAFGDEFGGGLLDSEQEIETMKTSYNTDEVWNTLVVVIMVILNKARVYY